jgi:type IV secretion system protein VirB6
MDSYLGLSNILNLVDASIQSYVQTTYQALSSALLPTLKLLMILYVSIFGIAHLTGRMPFDFWRTARHLAVMVVVMAFVTQWDFFTLYFANLFTNGPGQLMTIISGGTTAPNAMLGDVLDRGVMAANAINQTASLWTLGFLIVGYSLFYMTLVSVAYALYLLVLSKIALAILLGLAPIFFLFLLFDATRNFFAHYVRQVFNFALIPVFTSAVLSIMLKVPQQTLIRLQAELAAHSGHGGLLCVYVLLSFFILLGLLHQVTGFAAGISGGGLHLHPGGFAAMSAGVAIFAAQRGAKRMVEAAKRGREKIRSLRRGARS